MVLLLESRWVGRVNYQKTGRKLKKGAHNIHKRYKGARCNLNMITSKNLQHVIKVWLILVTRLDE